MIKQNVQKYYLQYLYIALKLTGKWINRIYYS